MSLLSPLRLPHLAFEVNERNGLLSTVEIPASATFLNTGRDQRSPSSGLLRVHLHCSELPGLDSTTSALS